MSRDYTNGIAELVNSITDKALAISNNNEFSVDFKLGFLEETIKELKNIFTVDENEIDRTTVIWLKGDVINKFTEEFGREPTDKELDEVIENIYFGKRAEEEAISIGRNDISDGLYLWNRNKK